MNMFKRLNEYILIYILSFLNNDDKINFLILDDVLINLINNAGTQRKKLVLYINNETWKMYKNSDVNKINFLNIDIDFKNTTKTQKDIIKMYTNYFKNHVINLKIKNVVFRSNNSIFKFLNGLNIENIELKNCNITTICNQKRYIIKSLNSLLLDSCGDNIYKAYNYNMKLKQICIINMNYGWNGFPHDIFNNILANNKSTIQKITFRGSGTGSYFDSDEFPYKITTLDTSMLTFHWYVGIQGARIDFLNSQINYLKDLTIHELPTDFDGGRVLKYIVEDMELEKFYYKDILLINNSIKQTITQTIDVSGIHIQSLFEIVRQFPTISSIRLNLDTTDLASDAIERIINPRTNIFKNITKFEINDRSVYRGVLGVFLGLFKNLSKVKILIIKSNDRNINTLLEIFLPNMNCLEEIYITGESRRLNERFTIIKNHTLSSLKKLSTLPEYLNCAESIFGSLIKIYPIIND